MLKVKLVYETPIAIMKDGKPVIEFDKKEESYIVASTKSYNNLIDDLKLERKIPTNTSISDLFIDKQATQKTISAFIATEIKDTDTAEYVTNHIIKALDGACVFKKPPIVRAKR